MIQAELKDRSNNQQSVPWGIKFKALMDWNGDFIENILIFSFKTLAPDNEIAWLKSFHHNEVSL